MSDVKKRQVDLAAAIINRGGSRQEVAEVALRDQLATWKIKPERLPSEIERWKILGAAEPSARQGRGGRKSADQSTAARQDLLPFMPRTYIALDQAASILAGERKGRAFDHWSETLADAVDAGTIRAGTWSMDRSEQPLLHADIRAWCDACGITWPVPFPEGLKSGTTHVDDDQNAELDRMRERIVELERERTALQKEIEATAATAATGEVGVINSPTLQRIMEAVEQYPAWRAAQPQEPNLKAVLGWQLSQQRDKGNGSRVAHVAHHVIAEHFGLKS